MFQQKATETVTLTRNQLQAILELITQIGGISRSESWNESKINLKNDNKIEFNNNVKENVTLDVNKYWERENDQLVSDWYSHKNDTEYRSSPLLMLNETDSSNQLLSPTLSECLKVNDSRADSAMTNETSSDSHFRRYARINDSEFDLNALHRKRMKALEYSRALALQHEEKEKKKLLERQRIREEEKLLDRKIEEQINKMKNDFESEQKLIEEKRRESERRREAVIAAIERTPIIKKRNFLVDNSPEPQTPVVTVAAIKPQTRTKETAAQTEQLSDCSQYRDTGTQTDVQLLLHLLKEMKLITKKKTKLLSKSAESLSSDSNTSVRALTPKILKKSTELKSDLKTDKSVTKRPVWAKNKHFKSWTKNNENSFIQKNFEIEKKPKENEIKIDSKTENNIKKQNENELNDRINVSTNQLKRNSLISSSVKNISELNSQRIKSSIETKSKQNFLPQISGRPHSRKKWYSQETFNPNFLN